MEKQCRFNGKRIYYTVTGDGPAVVFLHGFLEDSSLWDSVIPYFEDYYKVICIDLPGHGNTEVFGEVHSMNLMADTVAAVLKNETIKAAIITGHSLGGYVALAFAKRYSDICRGIVLLNSTAEPDSAEKKTDRMRAIKVARKSVSLFVNESIPKMFSVATASLFETELEKLKKAALKIPFEGIIASIKGMMERESSIPFLEKPVCPVLFIAGKNDVIIPENKSAEQITKHGNIKGVILDDSGHLSVIEQKDAVVFLLKSFFSELIYSEQKNS